jgi:hypothetical protein
MKDSDENKSKLSLGDLRMVPKTKEKSPDLKGRISIQRDLLETLVRQMEDDDADEISCNLAGWLNGSGDGRFISVVISPHFQKSESKNIGAWLLRD